MVPVVLPIIGSLQLFNEPMILNDIASPGGSYSPNELNRPGAGQPLYPEVVLGSLLSVLPMLVLFPFLQKYRARGLTFGAVVG